MGTLFEVNGSTGAVNFRQAGTSNLVLETAASLPGSGVEGRIFWKSDVDTLFVHNGTSFMGIGAGYNRVHNETPAGLVNGSNTLFTTAFAYVTGTLNVYRDGLLMKAGGVDYTETSPAAGTFTFVTAPSVSSVLTVSYSRIEAAMLPSMQKESMVVGTPSANYTGSTTVFDLSFAYTVGNNALLVYSSGVLMRAGVGNDYQETSSSQITFNSARTGGEIIQFVKLGYNDATGETNTNANVGTGTGTIFRDKIGSVMNLKTIKAGTSISITNNADDITISASVAAAGGWTDAGSYVTLDTATDQVRIGDGTAGVPALSFASDTDTGLFRNGGNDIRMSAGATTVMSWRISDVWASVPFGVVDGSASAPGIFLNNDTDTGIFRQGSGVLSITSNNFETHRFGAATATDGTLHTMHRMFFGSGASCSITGQKTTSVSTTPAYIGGVSDGLIIVTGNDGSNYFVDLLLSAYNAGAPVVIAQKVHQGTPSTRTYSNDGTGLLLAMGSGTYTIGVMQFDLGV